MDNFWHTVDELEPPIGKSVWTSNDPFKAIPKIRSDAWNGSKWNHYHKYGKCYWAFPITRKKDES